MKFIRFVKNTTYILGITLVTAILFSYLYFKDELPDTSLLREAKLQMPLRIYSQDQLLIAEFGEKRRFPLKLSQVPADVINAFIAAEDYRFYDHPGIDIIGLFRAASELITTGKIQSGGSTITMQLAKNFYLTNKKLFSRKIKEIFLALKIEKDLTKNEILELYLNKIYLGNRAYGIEAAARAYYGKSIDELDLAQIAMIAGLPKAPSKYNPINDPNRAIIRRNWILHRMQLLGLISASQYDESVAKPITAKYHGTKIDLKAPYVAETIRKELLEKYGKDIYTGGYLVTTTIDSKLQTLANTILIDGVLNGEERYGYRGSVANYQHATVDEWLEILNDIPDINILQPAIVTDLSTTDNSASVIMKDNEITVLSWNKIKWAYNKNTNTKDVDPVEQVLAIGDLILIRKTFQDDYKLSQEPITQAALVTMNPQNGNILAMVGGFNFSDSMYNRATQAKRQAGSVIKPFLYAAALENGMNAATIINDAPIVYNDNEGNEDWRPKNHNQQFKGPTRLREGLTLSRNLVSIRILRQIGIPKVVDYMKKLGFKESMIQKDFSMALGNVSVTPLEITTLYSILANGGYEVKSKLIDYIKTNDNEFLLKNNSYDFHQDMNNDTETNIEKPEQLMESRINYIINDMLNDVMYKTFKHKTKGARKDFYGKTGTTNNGKDTWFVGYNPDLVTGIWVGKDNNQSVGENAYGSNTAMPIWLNFMQKALTNIPNKKLDMPEGLVSLRISATTGKITKQNKGSIFELFQIENTPDISEDEKDNYSSIADNYETDIDNIF